MRAESAAFRWWMPIERSQGRFICNMFGILCRYACEVVGFLTVLNHGIEEELVQRFYDAKATGVLHVLSFHQSSKRIRHHNSARMILNAWGRISLTQLEVQADIVYSGDGSHLVVRS